MSLLRLESVTKSYWRGPHEQRVLRGAALELRAGSLLSVYGPRGSGKTALMEIATGFQRPAAGRVLFDGVDLATLSARELARVHRGGIGWIERGGPQLPDLTVEEYVALALYRDVGRRRAHRRARTALAAYGVEDCAGERWADLSDTARTLCAIAQAMARKPKLLIADDPTAGLGIVDRERIGSVLRTTAERDGVGVLTAVPDMSAMLHAHELLLLSRGRLLAPAERSSKPDATVVQFPDGRRSA
ncbi:MAG TPA: ATP-binding cassette domain-containing protein [Thermoleophilaceae bacterium]|nr:ATP-binding cassette domain-containing protein [Thermoleophilaceae bacterium]